MKYITGKYGWLLAFSCWLLAVSCSSDSSGEQQRSTGSPLQVVPYIAAYQSNDALSRRAVSTGYSAYTPNQDIAIGLYLLPEETPSVKLLRYTSDAWHSQTTVANNKDYTIYGFMPKKDPISSNITQNSENVVLTLSNIDAVSPDDICFITGVKDLTGDLLQGQFGYKGKSDENYIRLLMDHLFASVKFNFSVDTDYSKLRTIKLKSLKLSTTIAPLTATITLTPNSTDVYPATVEFLSLGEESTLATFFESTEGEQIPTTTTNFVCCFAPSASSTLSLVTTYDVYDSKGNLIRKDCEATNKLPDLEAQRGWQVTLNLKITPTYLYQLSEPDLDNPTIEIEN
jgi:hypothetical protein